MKNFLYLLLIIVFIPNSLAQATADSPPLLHFGEVDQIPHLETCKDTTPSCVIEEISARFFSHFDFSVLERIGTETAPFNLKFIIDTRGKVAWIRIQGAQEEIEKESIRTLKSLPAFVPGLHQGMPVNVLIDLPIKLDLEEEEIKDSSEIAYETPPFLPGCEDEEDVKRCTSERLQQMVFKNVRTSRIPKGEHWAEIKFAIEKDGKPRVVSITGSNERFKKEALRVAEKIPDFVPATKDGKEIEASYSLPMYARVR